MNKNDILRKAQLEKKDEREEHVKTKAFDFGWLSVTVVILILLFLRSYHNEPVNDLIIILMVQTAAASYYLYYEMRHKKGYFIAGIISTIAFFYRWQLCSVSTVYSK